MCQERERMEPLTRLRWKSHVYCTGVPFFLADVLAMVMGRRAPARGLDSNHASPRELGDLLTALIRPKSRAVRRVLTF